MKRVNALMMKGESRAKERIIPSLVQMGASKLSKASKVTGVFNKLTWTLNPTEPPT
jgi:hypothetical protein